MSLRATFLAVAAAMTVTSVAPAVRAQSTTVAASVSPECANRFTAHGRSQSFARVV